MGKDQAGLELGSPSESSNYGKQDEYPTAYNQEAPEYYERKRERSVTIAKRNPKPQFLNELLAACCHFIVLQVETDLYIRRQLDHILDSLPYVVPGSQFARGVRLHI
ncbi:hypothetical protein Q9189_006647 [Teloschistes chrysophthalmus]